METVEGIGSYILHMEGDKLYEYGTNKNKEIIWDGKKKEEVKVEEIKEKK